MPIVYDPKGPENITTLNPSTGRLFTAATQALKDCCCEDRVNVKTQPSPSRTTQPFDIGAALYDHFKILKEDMEALEVASSLKKNKVLEKSSYEKIVHQRTRRMRVDALIKALQESMQRESGNIKVYTEFIDALNLTGQQDVVHVLQTKLTPYKPTKYENENLLKLFEKRKKAILDEVEPLDVIDDMVVYRGLHLHDHEEIMQENNRKRRVDCLYIHLKTLPKDQAWRILKPIKDRYKELFSDVGREEKTHSDSLSSSASSSSTYPDSSSVTSTSVSSSTLSSSSDTSSATPSSDSSSGEEGLSMSLTVNFSPKRKQSIAVSDSTEHDHPVVQLRKMKELEKTVVDNVNNDPDKYKAALAKLMEDCTSSFKSLKFDSIRINLQALSDKSVEQLKEFCRDGRAKSLILSLLDEDSIQKLKELEATKASLDVYVDENKSFIRVIDDVGEGCLCTLSSKTVENHFDYVVEKIEDLEISFIDKVLESDFLAEAQTKELLKIKDCTEGNERRRKLVEFLLNENSSQMLFCILENEILVSGEAGTILRIQQTKPCKVSESNTIYTREATQITVSDLREHAELLQDELDPRWFLNTLQSRTDERSLQMVKTIQDSQSRKERTTPFLEYLYLEDNLHWFEETLEIHNKYIYNELHLHRGHGSIPIDDLKLAFMSAYDVITEDLEPLQLVKHLCASFLQKADFDTLNFISTRQERASFFFRKVLTMSDQRIGEVFEAMRSNYGDVVNTIEEILKCGSICEKYKCPRIRRCHGKSPECVFRTEISLFDIDERNSGVEPLQVTTPERPRKNKLASGFVQAEVTKYDKKKEYWSSYDRYNTNIGMIGFQGSCKRSLLNALCGRIETDEETAEVYVETDVKKFSSYKEARNVVLWDLPEIGTEQFPRETYLKEIDFKRYGCFAMLIPGQISLDDNILIAKEITHLHRKIILICTNKGNQHVPSTTYEPVAHCSSAENVNEKQAVEEVRENCYKVLKELGCTDIPVFIINEVAILSGNYDFDKLIAKLIEEVTDEKHMIDKHD